MNESRKIAKVRRLKARILRLRLDLCDYCDILTPAGRRICMRECDTMQMILSARREIENLLGD
jgi:hypothetical protein